MEHKNIVAYLESGESVFLTGGAGVGKTTATRQTIEEFEKNAKKVASLASTGMAATLINGQTLHSFFDFGISSNIDELKSNSKFEPSKKIKKLILSIDLIVIDEISMVSKSLFDMIYLRLEQASYGGVLLVVGDFLQLPPVARGYGEIMFAFESIFWQKLNFKTIELTHIYRTDNVEFIELLGNIRVGHVDETTISRLDSFVKPLPQDLSQFTLLFSKNESASSHNKTQLYKIDGELFVKEAQVIKHSKNIKDFEIDRFLQDARIDKNLELKIGAIILFTRNSWNYFNGERGCIVNIDASHVYVQKSSGNIIKLEPASQSKEVWVERDVNGKKEFVQEAVFTVFQFPIKLSYAITIHKSQGMSIENLIVDTNEIFAPSQFYVAISRSSNPKNLNLIAPKKEWRKIIFVNQKALCYI